MRAIARQALLARADSARVVVPEQGVNNRTFVVRYEPISDIVVKIRPRTGGGVRNSPQWPRYTQQLLGPVPNGDVSTLLELEELLVRHGTIRVPRIYAADTSLELVPSPFFVAELLPGEPFDWDGNAVGSIGAEQLGSHLGSLHAATTGDGFGIFARRHDFALEDWWRRFGRAYRTVADELARGSARVAAVREKLDRPLQWAESTPPPSSSVLVCVDQSPSHYLGSDDGRISGMVDLEAHVWAPREYELAIVELWLRDLDTFRTAYERHLPWPEGMEGVRIAYWLFTWMEWIYCVHTLVHDDSRAEQLERRLTELVHEWVP